MSSSSKRRSRAPDASMTRNMADYFKDCDRPKLIRALEQSRRDGDAKTLGDATYVLSDFSLECADMLPTYVLNQVRLHAAPFKSEK